MATITLNDEAVKDSGVELGEGAKVHFTFANSEFDVGPGETFDTASVEDEAQRLDLESNAPGNPWLKVEFPVPEPDPQPEPAPAPPEPQPQPAPNQAQAPASVTNTAPKETK